MRDSANLLSKVISTLNQTSSARAFNFLFILFINIKYLFNHPLQCFSLYNIDSYLNISFILSILIKKKLFLEFLDSNYRKYHNIHFSFLMNVKFSTKCIISCLWDFNKTSNFSGSLGSCIILFLRMYCLRNMFFVCMTKIALKFFLHVFYTPQIINIHPHKCFNCFYRIQCNFGR